MRSRRSLWSLGRAASGAPLTLNVSTTKMSKALNNLFWHDGNLVDVSFAIDKKGKAIVQLTALFYKDELGKVCITRATARVEPRQPIR